MSKRDRARFQNEGTVFRDGKLIPKQNVDPPQISKGLGLGLPFLKYGMLIYPEHSYTCRRCKQHVLGKNIDSHRKQCLP